MIILWFLLLIPLAVLLYFFSRQSRRRYRCPQCHEEITTEYLEATRCGMCGAELAKK